MPGQIVENVKRHRHEEATAAAAAVGASFESFDLGDYPLIAGQSAVDQLAELMRDYKPNVVLTHVDKDPFNPDHPAAFNSVMDAMREVDPSVQQAVRS